MWKVLDWAAAARAAGAEGMEGMGCGITEAINVEEVLLDETELLGVEDTATTPPAENSMPPRLRKGQDSDSSSEMELFAWRDGDACVPVSALQ